MSEWKAFRKNEPDMVLTFRIQDRRIIYNLTKCSRKKEGYHIVCAGMREGYGEIQKAFSFPECSEQQKKKAASHMREQTPYFLSVLFEKGCGEFYKAVKHSAAAFKLSLDFESITEEKGEWRNRKGQVFDPASGSWVGNGEMVQDALSLILWDICNGKAC